MSSLPRSSLVARILVFLTSLSPAPPSLQVGTREVVTKPLSIIFEKSWLSGEVPDDWRKSYVTPIYKKGSKENPGNYRPVSLTTVPGKIMEQILLDNMLDHVRNERVI